ncbi:methylaspartate mutase accessory protein GlmL [soil metagenome]
MCVDVGSTYTKASLIDSAAGAVCDRGQVATTLRSDVWDGVREVRDQLAARDPQTPPANDRERVRICSSAGGGLRLAVVGFERVVSAEAGRWVALSAGARIVHICDGDLGSGDIDSLRGSAPDLILLVGGTDGGNSSTLLRNAQTLADASLPSAMVVAGNREVQDTAVRIVTCAGGVALLADNVLPAIGQIAPASARATIRAAFLQHVIGGKELSRHADFAAGVRAPTPDAVLDGVSVLRDVADEDVMVIDVGGATTDVYSAIMPQGEDALLAKEVVARLPLARTVEADLGMRHSAPGVLQAATREGLLSDDSTDLVRWADEVAGSADVLPGTDAGRSLDLRLAAHAALLAARRHGRPSAPGGSPRPLSDVGVLIGSGGVLRHAPQAAARATLRGVVSDIGGGWRPPDQARLVVDTAYLLGGIGLLAEDWPHVAASLARSLLDQESR